MDKSASVLEDDLIRIRNGPESVTAMVGLVEASSLGDRTSEKESDVCNKKRVQM